MGGSAEETGSVSADAGASGESHGDAAVAVSASVSCAPEAQEGTADVAAETAMDVAPAPSADGEGSGQRADWAAARYAVEETNEPIDSICKRLGIAKWQLERVRRREKWKPRWTSRAAARASRIEELDRQLVSLTSGLAGKLEDRVKAEGATDAALKGLAELLRARTALDGERTKGDRASNKKNKNNDGPAGHGGRAGSGGPAGADRAPQLRAEVAEGLNRLRGAQGPGKSPR
jgi:hypothetical protein